MDNNSFILILISMLIVMAVLMLFINSRHKKQMNSLMQLQEQQQDLKAVPAGAPVTGTDVSLQKQAAAEIIELTEDKKDAESDGKPETEASAYNTGNSGKIYTKEELELLIKE